MLRRLRRTTGNQKGFTLLEVVAAFAITGLIGASITMAVYHTINVNSRSVNHVIAVTQVEKVAYAINRDVLMAQTIQPGGISGFPLDLSWVEWDNTTHQVSYTLGNGELRRSHSVNGGAQNLTVVAEYISADADETNCQYANGVFTFTATASLAGPYIATETRMAQVIPRSTQ